MQNAETNFVKIIREVCREEDIELRSYSADWIFRLDKNGRHDVILGYQFGLNSASVNMLCQDKCAASELMTEFGIPNTPFSSRFLKLFRPRSEKVNICLKILPACHRLVARKITKARTT